jgi:hypothetical protein
MYGSRERSFSKEAINSAPEKTKMKIINPKITDKLNEVLRTHLDCSGSFDEYLETACGNPEFKIKLNNVAREIITE